MEEQVDIIYDPEELAKDLFIDVFALEDELNDHPRRLSKWSVRMVEAMGDRDWKKRLLDREEAILDTEIRENPNKFGVKKFAETAVKKTILLQESYQEAETDYYKALKLYRLLEAAVKAIEARKRMILGEVDLWIKEYYSDLRVRSDVSEAMDGAKSRTQRDALSDVPRLQERVRRAKKVEASEEG